MENETIDCFEEGEKEKIIKKILSDSQLSEMEAVMILLDACNYYIMILGLVGDIEFIRKTMENEFKKVGLKGTDLHTMLAYSLNILKTSGGLCNRMDAESKKHSENKINKRKL